MNYNPHTYISGLVPQLSDTAIWILVTGMIVMTCAWATYKVFKERYCRFCKTKLKMDFDKKNQIVRNCPKCMYRYESGVFGGSDI